MGRTENLKLWPKGVSGNPGGRPKKKPITEAYQAAIAEPLPKHLRKFKIGRNEIELVEGATFADLIAIGQCVAASKGSTAAAEEIANRLEGKVAQQVELGGSINLAETLKAARARLARFKALEDGSVIEASIVTGSEAQK